MKACGTHAGDEIKPEGQVAVAYLVVTHKGPTWDLADIEPFCRLLSRRFAGEVWAFGSYDTDILIGRIRLRVVAERSSMGVANLARFARRAVGWIEELRTAQVPQLAFVSLDPFTGGLLALYAARRAKGVLICEINGVYGSPHNTADTRAASLRAIRVLLRRVVGALVLRRAAAVRLLFADQLKGFATLPGGVRIRQFFEASNLALFHRCAEEPIILAVGFPFKVKGFDTLCAAFNVISKRCPDWKLVLIGHRVPEEVRAGGFEHPRIEAYPGLKQPQIAEWMARCSIFVLPSRTEAMGRVLLEAAASGKCRVAARVDGIPTVVEDGVDGVLVESEDVEGLVTVLELLIRDESLRQRLGSAAKIRVDREFSSEAYLDHYGDLVAAALRQDAA